MLPKRSLERKVKLQQLVNKGNFKHNITVMREGKGEIVVGRRCTSKAASDYTACGFCKKFQLKTSLWRHTKFCMARKEYFEKTEESKRIVAVKRGRSLVTNAVFSDTSENDLVSELLQHMRNDDVKTIVMSDQLICREAVLRMAALGSKADEKHDDKYRVSQATRTLGRIVQLPRETTGIPNATLTSLIEPRHFDLMVDVAKKLLTDKETPALNVGRTIGILLTKVSMSKYCLACHLLSSLERRWQ